MYHKIKNIHLIGIGGIGMSGLAQLLVRHGYTVSGSDLGRGETVRHLEALGVRIYQGHRPEHLQDAELVVYSSAIRNENPELEQARRREILSITRGEMLAELMRFKYGIAVAGAHGKTTTTSLLGVVLVNAGLDPTVVVGGRVDNFGGTNARMGQGDFMVVEADESDGSFNRLSPSIAVITNIDREHLDHYGSMENLEDDFVTFANKVPFFGLTIYCGDDPILQKIHGRFTRRKKTYGFSAGCSYQISEYNCDSEGTRFKVLAGRDAVDFYLRIPGRHNAVNAVAAFAVAEELGASRAQIVEALAEFRGVARRFQWKGQLNGVRFFDDYAHHPTEILATIAAAKERFSNSKVRVLFQPHRYSRFRDQWEGFLNSFDLCESVAVTEVYPAGEKPLEGISSERFVRELGTRHSFSVFLAETASDGLNRLIEKSSPGDIVLTLGAGDLPNVYQKLF